MTEEEALRFGRVLAPVADVGALPNPTGAGLRLGDVVPILGAGFAVLTLNISNARTWTIPSLVAPLRPENLTRTPGMGGSGQIDLDIQTEPNDEVTLYVVDVTDGSNVTPSHVGGAPGQEIQNSGAASPARVIGLTDNGGLNAGHFKERFVGTSGHNYVAIITSAGRTGTLTPGGTLP